MRALIIMLGFFGAACVHAGNLVTTLSVPFQNVPLNPGNMIRANYAFSSQPLIFCYENNLQTIGVVTWPYKGKIYSAPLSLYLKTNGNYQGSFADNAGTLTVTNNQSIPLVVSCQYAL